MARVAIRSDNCLARLTRGSALSASAERLRTRVYPCAHRGPNDDLACPFSLRHGVHVSVSGFGASGGSAAAEIYRLDGSETQLRDLHTGASLDRTHRFTLVAGALALTHTSTRTEAGGPRQSNRRLTTIITDAYSVAGDVLTVERQHSVLLEPPGHLVTLMNPGNNRQTIVYRRATQTNAR